MGKPGKERQKKAEGRDKKQQERVSRIFRKQKE